MKFAVTVLAHRRPDYLAQTLAALARQLDDQWEVLVVLDRPDPVTIGLTMGWPSVMLELRNHDDAPYLRVSKATLAALSLGFGHADYVVHVEEDCVPDPGFLDWHVRQAERFRSQRSEVFTACAWSGPPGFRRFSDADVSTVPEDYLDRMFTPWGWGTWRDRFEQMREQWDLSGGQWDIRVNEVVRGNRLSVFPPAPLVRNIGVKGGVNPPQEWQR